jgi:hypothetical protein
LLPRAHNIGAFDPAHFADGFGPVFLAMCMHYNIPDAIQPMRNKDAAGIVTYTALTGNPHGATLRSMAATYRSVVSLLGGQLLNRQ